MSLCVITQRILLLMTGGVAGYSLCTLFLCVVYLFVLLVLNTLILCYFMRILFLSDSELVIFLADLKAPYFKPKVHLTKEAFPR